MARVRSSSTRTRTAIFAPIGDEGRAERVERRLAQAITSGILTDGERLPSEPELAAMLGVATVTAREALISLRSQGLVRTTRGRGGGSFVTSPKHLTDTLLEKRLVAMSRIELRDHGTLYAVVVSGCAELAAHRASEDDVEGLRDLLSLPDDATIGQHRHAEAEYYLSLAALTQSARMTREVVKLESEFGAMLRMPYADQAFRAAALARNLATVDAIAAHEGDDSRRSAGGQITAALDWLAARHAKLR